MLEQLTTWDKELLLFLNQFHTTFLDPVAFYLTKTEFWIPLYLFLLYVIFREKKKEGWLVVIGIAACILLTDRITSGLMKPYFQRLRPSHDPSMEGLVHLVNNYRGGLYSFASSHAANTVGVALFIFLLLRDRYQFVWLIFLWAAVMSYTRIYLGVHFPGDILVGAIIGLAFGFAAFRSYLWLKSRRAPTTKSG